MGDSERTGAESTPTQSSTDRLRLKPRWWGVRRLVEQLERERDVWRALAGALLQKEGIQVPEVFFVATELLPPTKPEPPDRWRPGT
jgi:hypothetical protein